LLHHEKEKDYPYNPKLKTFTTNLETAVRFYFLRTI